MILVLIVLGALFFSGVKLRIFILPAARRGSAPSPYFAVDEPRPHAAHPELPQPGLLADYYNDCYQPLHGIWGLAGGGIFGLGLGNSKEKYDWLPEAAERLHLRHRRRGTRAHRLRRRPRPVRALRGRRVPCHPQDRRPLRAHRRRRRSRSGSSVRRSSTSASCCGSSRCWACRCRSCRRAAPP